MGCGSVCNSGLDGFSLSAVRNKLFVRLLPDLFLLFSLFLFSPQSLDGFVFALNKEGRFLYISETVSIYLGLSQVSALEIFTLPALFVHRCGRESGQISVR